MEEWKDVIGYEGLYEVSDAGRIRNKKSGRNLRPCIHRTGYASVMLYKNGIPRRFLIHRITAEAFLKKDGNKDYINHIDENKTNNAARNLEWCTREYNMAHGSISRRMAKARGHEARIKREVRQIDVCGRTVAVYESIADAARKTGTARTSIYECCNNIHKSANGYAWAYK